MKSYSNHLEKRIVVSGKGLKRRNIREYLSGFWL